MTDESPGLNLAEESADKELPLETIRGQLEKLQE